MRTTRVLTLLAVPALIGIACSSDEAALTLPAGVEVYTAVLSGAAERPTPVTTTATGAAVITVIGNLVSWKVTVTDIDSIILGHIHKGVVDSAGGVVVNFAPAPTGLNFTGTATQGSAVVVDSVLTLMRGDRAYVNIHTRVNGGGELRGQLVRQ